MKRLVAGLFLMLMLASPGAHIGMNAPTWNREISRLVYDRCASCHREEGAAFSRGVTPPASIQLLERAG